MDNVIDKILDWVEKQWKLILISVLSFFFLPHPTKLFTTLLIIAGLELFALQIYEYIIRFVISNKFLLDKFDGEDTKFSIMETAGFTQFQAAALISAHFLVAISAYGMYYIQFAPPN